MQTERATKYTSVSKGVEFGGKTEGAESRKVSVTAECRVLARCCIVRRAAINVKGKLDIRRYFPCDSSIIPTARSLYFLKIPMFNLIFS